MELPLELRESIYEYIFEAKGSQPIATRLSRKNGNSAHSTICPTAILSTCRQIHAEASSVLYRLRSAKIIVNRKATKLGYNLQSIDVAACNGFTRLDMDITVSCKWLYIEYGQKKKGHTLGHMLSNWVDMLVSALNFITSGGSRTINLHFRSKGWLSCAADLHSYTYPDEDWAKVCWFRTQATAAVVEMRQDLQTRLPAIAFTITSNVEIEYPWLRVTRESALRLKFEQLVARRIVQMSMDKSEVLTTKFQNVALYDVM